MADIAAIPQPKYTAYRRFIKDGDREEYEAPYFSRRAKLSALVFRAFLGVEIARPAVPGAGLPLKTLIEDYIWAICDETNWVLPAHEGRPIDLFSAETAFTPGPDRGLARRSAGRGGRAPDLCRGGSPRLRALSALACYPWGGTGRQQLERRLQQLGGLGLPAARARPAPRRRGARHALQGLQTFLDTAFESDGSSNEGVGYWGYGLINLIALVRDAARRQAGAIDPLASPRLSQIAAYPPAVQLSRPVFAAFSDCHEETTSTSASSSRWPSAPA